MPYSMKLPAQCHPVDPDLDMVCDRGQLMVVDKWDDSPPEVRATHLCVSAPSPSKEVITINICPGLVAQFTRPLYWGGRVVGQRWTSRLEESYAKLDTRCVASAYWRNAASIVAVSNPPVFTGKPAKEVAYMMQECMARIVKVPLSNNSVRHHCSYDDSRSVTQIECTPLHDGWLAVSYELRYDRFDKGVWESVSVGIGSRTMVDALPYLPTRE